MLQVPKKDRADMPEATNLLNEKYKPFPSLIICTIFIVVVILVLGYGISIIKNRNN